MPPLTSGSSSSSSTTTTTTTSFGCRSLCTWLIIVIVSTIVHVVYCYDDESVAATTNKQTQTPNIGQQEPTGVTDAAWVNIGIVLRPADELLGSDLRKEVEKRLDEINKQFAATERPAGGQTRLQIKLISATLVKNPVEMSRIVCDQLIGGSGGVVAVIVDTDQRYIDSIASISFTLGLYNIPCIGTTMRDSSLFNKNLHPSYISLTPPHSHQADVWYNLMNELQFVRAIVLTSSEDRDLLARFVELLEQQQQQQHMHHNNNNNNNRNNKPTDSEFRIESIIEYDAGSFGQFSQGWNYIVGKISSLLENSMCRVFLVHGQSQSDVEFFLRIIRHLNMTGDGFAIVLSEETSRVALEHKLPLPSGILTSKLHSSNGTDAIRITTNQHHRSAPMIAYALDALEILSRSISDLSLDESQPFRLGLFSVPNSCQSGSGSINAWLKGIELYLSILRQTFMGQTGFIMFDENDDRLSANYKLLNLVDAVGGDELKSSADGRSNQIFKTIGSFTNGMVSTTTGDRVDATTMNESTSYHERKISVDVGAIQWPGGVRGKLISGVFIDRHLRIVTLLEKPFVWVSSGVDCLPAPTVATTKSEATKANFIAYDNSTTTTLPCTRTDPRTGREEKLCCKGYCMDLLQEISRSLNFTYELYLVGDNHYGRLEVAGGGGGALSEPDGTRAERRTKTRMDLLSSSLFRDNSPAAAIISTSTPAGDTTPGGGAGFGAGALPATPTWTGIMGELVLRQADMAFAPLTITPTRAQVIDFSKPFKFHGFSILLRRAAKHTTLASFLQPFHNQLWILVIGVATHVVALTLYLLDRYSTFGRFGMKRQFIPTRTKSSHDDHPLHLSSSLWFSWSILLNSGVGEHTPKSLSGRVLGIFWSGFAMIVVASYTANLAAFLVLDSREETPTLSGIDDPRLRSGDLAFNFATVKGSAVDSYMQSQVEYINLYRKMEEFNFNNVDESILALRAGIIDALIWDSTRLEWEVATDDKCSLGIAGELFGSSGYGIGLQKDSYWTKNVTTKLLELHEAGFMMELDKKWIAAGKSLSPQAASAGGCERRNEDYPETLGIVNIAGVFILFACGLVASFGLIVIERFCYRHRAKLLKFKIDLWQRLTKKARQTH